jgi:DNA-binding IclR family transcriptional regulator
MNGRSHIIPTATGRVILAEHTEAVFLCSEGGVFLTDEQLDELIKECRAIRQRRWKRAVTPS